VCGIAGIVALDGRRVPGGLVERMAATLTHRGPDDCGHREGPSGALGHRRLSIIDLSPDARQPMVNEAGDVALVCNGEIYNHVALREPLLGAGHEFRSRSDSEVILHLYEDHADAPEQVLDALDGMFAFGIHDERRGRLFLARDRLGIKPLYYARTGGFLIFASEPKAILASGMVDPRPDLSSVANYLTFRHPVGAASMYAEIHALEPGHYLVADAGERGGEVRVARYWDIARPDRSRDLGADVYAAGVRDLLGEAVRKRLMSDVPIGAYLSGGLDSSIVVALMAQMSDEPVKTYSVGFGTPDDEFPFARMVAERYGTDHHEVVLDAPGYFDLLPRLIQRRDAPLGVPNEVPLYEMSRALKQDFTVVLSGEGADELFGGYGDYARTPFDWRKGQIVGRLPSPLRSLASGGLEEKYGAGAYEPDLARHFLAGYRWFPERELAGLLRLDTFGDAIEEGRARVLDYFERTEDWDDPYDRVLYTLERMHLVNLLQRVDAMTMATAVEARVPFVDHRLVEYAFGIPARHKLRWRSPLHRARAWLSYSDRFRERDDTTKYVLRRAAEDLLPPEITSRRKVGFKVPLEQSLASDVMRHARTLLLDERTRARGVLDVEGVRTWLDAGAANGGEFGLRAWMLTNLELWFRLQVDGDDVDESARALAVEAA
jgi:asparagine synthase (glutamine-hydrolysing)